MRWITEGYILAHIIVPRPCTETMVTPHHLPLTHIWYQPSVESGRALEIGVGWIIGVTFLLSLTLIHLIVARLSGEVTVKTSNPHKVEKTISFGFIAQWARLSLLYLAISICPVHKLVILQFFSWVNSLNALYCTQVYTLVYLDTRCPAHTRGFFLHFLPFWTGFSGLWYWTGSGGLG